VSSDTPDIGALMAQIGQMQQNLEAAQQSAAAQVVVGRAGGGAVTVSVTGGLDVQQVHIDAAVVDPNDISLLEDLLLAAIRDAIEQANALQRQALGGLEGLLGGG
jgi:DNA-binding YbaB/EbfC family protein